MAHLSVALSLCCEQIPTTSSKSLSNSRSSSGVRSNVADFSAIKAALLYLLTAVSPLREAGSKHYRQIKEQCCFKKTQNPEKNVFPASDTGGSEEVRLQGWPSAESTRLPPMWPGFESWRRRHMWVEFVVGSLSCSERFFFGYSGFPLSLKANTSKFQFDLERTNKFQRVFVNS